MSLEDLKKGLANPRTRRMDGDNKAISAELTELSVDASMKLLIGEVAKLRAENEALQSQILAAHATAYYNTDGCYIAKLGDEIAFVHRDESGTTTTISLLSGREESEAR